MASTVPPLLPPSRSSTVTLLLMTTAVSAVILLSLIQPCHGAPKLYVFGDSVLDTGNGNHRNLEHKADVKPFGMSLKPPRPTGRFSDGHVLTDFMAQRMGILSPPPYLFWHGEPTYQSGMNFAVAGAGTRRDSGFVDDASLYDELIWFRTFTKKAKITKKELWRDGVALLSIGTNDFLKHFSKNLPTAYVKKSTDVWSDPIVNVTLGALKILHENGLRRFVVLNVGALGCAPGVRSHAFWAKGRCMESGNDAVKIFNNKLDDALVVFRRRFPRASVTLFDSFNAWFQVSQDKNIPTIQGACCGYPKPINGKQPCGVQPQNICEDPAQYLFWDKAHMTHATNGALSQYIWNGSRDFIRPINLATLVGKVRAGAA